MSNKKSGINTRMVHSGGIKDKFGSAVTPIYQSSTFYFKNVQEGADRFAGTDDGYIYTRLGNPTISDLENAVADLENGAGGIATSSGMAAINVVYLGLLKQGDHMISTASVYGPARGIMEGFYPRFGISSTYASLTNLDQLRAMIQDNTKLIYIETPTNPTMEISDIEAISKIARKKGIIVCVDNTFCSPYLQKPLDLGADIVLHSLTKFINGHADIVGGLIVPKTQEMLNLLRPVMINFGFNMDPHQAFLTRRGLKTLGIRIERAQENTMEVAKFLENHPKVDHVLYPGLESHPQYNLASKQMLGPGAMLSIFLNGGYDAGRKLMEAVRLPLLAVSLGGIESLIQHPASMTHSKLSREVRKSAGISDGLVRLSVGIEDVRDLIDDFKQALDKI
jgi:methionine-gamma-lyase